MIESGKIDINNDFKGLKALKRAVLSTLFLISFTGKLKNICTKSGNESESVI